MVDFDFDFDFDDWIDMKMKLEDIRIYGMI